MSHPRPNGAVMVFNSFDTPRRPEQPDEGFYLVHLVRKGPLVPCQILRRRTLWGTAINGLPPRAWYEKPWADPTMMQVWLGERTTREEHDRRLALTRIPGHPAQTPYKAISLADLPAIPIDDV